MRRKSTFSLLFIIAIFFVSATSAQVTNSGNIITINGSCLAVPNNTYTVALNYFKAPSWKPGPDNTVFYVYNSVVVSTTGTVTTLDFTSSVPQNGAPAINTLAANVISATGNVNVGGSFLTWTGNQNNCVPLPIILEYFHAALSSDHQYAVCTWRTDQEENSSHFFLQRSTDAVNFSNVGIEPAAGNSSIPINYTFTTNIIAGTDYFRLQEVDLDGHTYTSSVVPITVAAGTYPTTICSFETIASGPNPLCPGAAGTYRIHNAPIGITWSVNPSSDPLSITNGGSVAQLTNTAYSSGYTGTTVLTASGGGCSKPVTLLNAAPVSNITINGPATICTGSQSYSLSSTTGISSINWASSSPTIAYVSPNGGTTLLTKAGTNNGNVNLSATYYVNDNVSGCAFPIVKTNSIAVGAIIHFTYNITGTQYKTVTANCDVVNGATSYLWTLNLGSHGTTTYPSRSMSGSLPPCSGGGLTINVSGSCGSAQDGVTVFNSYCGPSFAVSPNPAKSSLTITTQEPQQSFNAATTNQVNNNSSVTTAVSNVTRVEIYSKSGRLVFMKKFAGNQKQISLSLPTLAPDNYVIQIYSNNTKEVQQLQILQ